jgi:hypothetical protein
MAMPRNFQNTKVLNYLLKLKVLYENKRLKIFGSMAGIPYPRTSEQNRIGALA